MGWRNQCLLCRVTLDPIDGTAGLQQHPESDECNVKVTDSFGIAMDPAILDELQAEDLQQPDPRPVADDGEVINLFRPADEVLQEIFDGLGLPRLGGASTGRGWTSVALFQRCPYAWKLRHVAPLPELPFLRFSDPNIDIGAIVHTFLGLAYSQKIYGSPYQGIDLEVFRDLMIAKNARAETVAESWRLFQGHQLYYKFDNDLWQPMAVEYDIKDPRNGESCRYDLIAFLPEDQPALLAGTYIIEHKTAQRFDRQTLDGWSNDGEVIGQVKHWKRLGLDNKFGPLRGVIVNIIGKQKEQKFHRVHVNPSSMLVSSHEDDLRRWEGLIQLAKSSNNFPRARANCINRWGMCKHWDHCATEET